MRRVLNVQKMIPKVRKYGRIDKSQLMYGEAERLVDKAYRHPYKDATCLASRNGIDLCMRSAVGAHCRAGEYAGGAQKPTDQLTIPLCHECHSDQELYQGPQAEWWLENVLKPQMRRRYRRWRRGCCVDPEVMMEEQGHE